MKLLAYTDSSNIRWSSAIVEMTNSELRAFCGDNCFPTVGTDVQPLERIRASNRVLDEAKKAQSTAAQLRAMATMLDTVSPGLDDVVNPPPVPEADSGSGDCP